MNDFTKQELAFMLDSIYFNEREHHMEKDIPQYPKKLMDKLQSMIDNYCEHENLGFVGGIYGYECKKCNKTITGVTDEQHHRSMNE